MAKIISFNDNRKSNTVNLKYLEASSDYHRSYSDTINFFLDDLAKDIEDFLSAMGIEGVDFALSPNFFRSMNKDVWQLEDLELSGQDDTYAYALYVDLGRLRQSLQGVDDSPVYSYGVLEYGPKNLLMRSLDEEDAVILPYVFGKERKDYVLYLQKRKLKGRVNMVCNSEERKWERGESSIFRHFTDRQRDLAASDEGHNQLLCAVLE